MESLLENAGDVLNILRQEVGMHLTVTLRDSIAANVSDQAVAAAAGAEGMAIEPLSACSAAASSWQGFLLGFAGWSETELRSGGRRLADILRASAKSQ